ncbi:hypothetical protein IGI04_032833, partial [Brassica rapa subsp. trilocularis]
MFETDVKPSQSRLSIPFHKLIQKWCLGVVLVDQGAKKWGMFLRRWEMNGSWNYALVCGWNDVVKANGLKDGDNISLWSFRCRGVLCFAFAPLCFLFNRNRPWGMRMVRRRDGGTAEKRHMRRGKGGDAEARALLSQ